MEASVILDFINEFTYGRFFLELSVIVTSLRFTMKPICTLWNKKVALYIDARPTEKLMKHPAYKFLTYLLDVGASTKAPQSKEK